jgi:hypothetical protein
MAERPRKKTPKPAMALIAPTTMGLCDSFTGRGLFLFPSIGVLLTRLLLAAPVIGVLLTRLLLAAALLL